MIDFLNNLAVTHPWIPLTISIYLVVVKALQGVRDAIDHSPATDDNWFERTVTILGKTIGYLGGVRPQSPANAIPAPGESKDATGVKTVIK